MVKALLGKKIGMTQVFDEAGAVVPATVLQVGPCMVTQVKTPSNDSVAGVQIGFDEANRKRLTRSLAGHFSAAGVAPQRVLRDVDPDGAELPEVGRQIGVDIFEGIAQVDVIGVSKGRGTAGVVKRHGFRGQPETHGGRTRRLPGSIGSNTSPGRVWKGKRMAGHMGSARVTVRNLRVLRIDPERNIMLVKGCVPGHNGSCVMVRKAVSLEQQAARAAQE
jgi:large subunit ribosomal protein L3